MTKRTLGRLRTQIHTGLLMSNDLALGGRRALVTGGTKGIGAAVAAPEEPVKQGSSAIKRRFFTSTWSRHLRVGLLTISLLMYGFPMSGASAEDTMRLEHFPLIMKHIRNCGSNWHIRRAERRRVDLRCGSTSLRPSARRLFGAAP